MRVYCLGLKVHGVGCKVPNPNPNANTSAPHREHYALEGWILEIALFCISFLRKGEVLDYVGLPQNLKDLMVTKRFDCTSGNDL